jgi:Flp pilus assembly protein TadB
MKQKVLKEVDFFLPIVMERVVMAVEAGIDVLPALKRIVELDSTVDGLSAEASQASSYTEGVDPVTTLLSLVVCLVESGISFEDALEEVASSVESPALKHAFIHLAVAHQEGGELTAPLRELSEATQLNFQESIEEDIAKMPVRATLPLLLTFAGLILFFITAPLMQVLGMMSNAMPK